MMRLAQDRNRGQSLPLFRGLVPIAISLALIWALWGSFEQIDLAAITATTRLFDATQWAAAAVLTIISFAAVAQYDRLVAAWMGLELPRRLVIHAGWRATAIAQVLGYGLVTGSLARWRALGSQGPRKGLTLWDCSRLTLGVTLSFFAGWAVVTGFVVLIVPAGTFPPWATALSLACIVAAVAVLAASVAPRTSWAHYVPGPVFVIPTIGYAALDTLAAAAVLYIFLQDSNLPFILVYAAFLVALFAGMVSGLPAGLGAFEITLLSLLPAEPATVLPAVLAFRLIYYAAPAALAGVSLILDSSAVNDQNAGMHARDHLPDALITEAPPEFDLTCQGPLRPIFYRDLSGAILWHRGRNCDITLGDPFGTGDHTDLVSHLIKQASPAGRGLAMYKCSQKVAKSARDAGMNVKRIGSEALVDTTNFSTEGSAYRQLRRKLRQAQKAGICVTEDRPRYAELAEIDAEWQRRAGGARQFSMGYLCPRLLARQRVFIATQNDKPVAFISMLIAEQKWTLDLVRAASNCPDGTIHLLVAAAIEAAHQESVPTLSLAGAPFKLQASPSTPSEHLVQRAYDHSPHAQGLAQFKTCFNPVWAPNYLAVSSLWALPYAALDLWQLIHAKQSQQERFNIPHDNYQNYEIESCAQPCHALGRMTTQDAPDDSR